MTVDRQVASREIGRVGEEPTRFGPYRVVRELGAGGMGAVWEAVHEKLDKRVAVKTLHGGIAENPDAVKRFMREGRAASRIRHPHIVDVTDVGVERGQPYLVMEFLAGEPLSDAIERERGLSIAKTVEVALPVADALHTAHLAGVVHRDLKPDNIFLTRDRRGDLHPIVLDFGISKLEEDGEARLTQTRQVMGTPYYMSPEQARGAKGIDARSDQFSFGLVLYECLSGQRAVEGDTVLEVIHKIATGAFAPLSELCPDLPAALRDAVERMIAPERDERFANMEEVARALLPFAEAPVRARWERVFTRADELAQTGLAQSSPAQISPAQESLVETGLAATGLAQPPGATPTAPTPPSKSRSGVWIGIGAAVTVGLGLVAFQLLGPDAPETGSRASHAATEPPPTTSSERATPGPPRPAPDPVQVRVRAIPPDATLFLDGERVGRGRLDRTLPQDGTTHVLEIRADGYIPTRIELVDLAPPSSIALETAPQDHQGALAPRRFTMTERGLVPVPDDAQPDESQPDESQPDESQPDESQPDESQPDESQPDESQPDESQPDESQPDESQPDESQPDESQPDESQPDESQPDESQPDESQPDESQPDESQPDESQPDESQPDESQPDESQPDESQPDESQPDESQPDESQPDESQPARRARAGQVRSGATSRPREPAHDEVSESADHAPARPRADTAHVARPDSPADSAEPAARVGANGAPILR